MEVAGAGAAKGLKGVEEGVPKGDGVVIALGAKGFDTVGDAVAAKGLTSAGVSTNRTCLLLCGPRGVSPPPRPFTIVPLC